MKILEGTLKCQKCNEIFKITNGIPRFVVDETKDFVKTEDAFSAKWRTYHKSYHEKKWFDFQRNWYLERFQWNSLINFNKFLKTRKFILDAGTGLGNSAKYHSTNKNSFVFALDASESIDFAYKKYGKDIKHSFYCKLILEYYHLIKNFLILFTLIKFYIIPKILGTSFKYLTKFLNFDNGVILNLCL